MSKTHQNETGHAKNVANFEELNSFCTSYGALYNPVKASIKTAGLTTALTNARTAVTAVNNAFIVYDNAVSARKLAFKPLDNLITRVYSSLNASDVTEQLKENAKTIVRKLHGRRASQYLTDEEEKAAKLKAETEGTKFHEQVSSSQMSFDNRIDNFDKLIKLLASIPAYNPNEADLKVAALTTLLTDLKAKNTAVINAIVSISNARIQRNDILYKKTTGLIDISIDVKNYIKSVFGASGNQFLQISKIKFTNLR